MRESKRNGVLSRGGPRARKVLIVAAGSGGHIFPAIAFCQQLTEDASGSFDLVFLTTSGNRAAVLVPAAFHPVSLNVDRGLLGLLRLFFLAVKWISTREPDIVIGFGGYVSIPFILLAKLYGKRTLIHEQNVRLGRANRFLSRIADTIAVSFPKTREEVLRIASKKEVCLVSFPLRRSLKRLERQEALRFFGLRPDVFSILVLGGSQGAAALNDLFLRALEKVGERGRLQILHLSGACDFEKVRSGYKKLGVCSKVVAFLEEMHYAYSMADLVVSRSGAGVVHEIIHYGLASILIPYAHAGAHQRENARVLAEDGAAILLEKDKINPEILSGLLSIFIDDRIRIRTMSSLASKHRSGLASMRRSGLASNLDVASQHPRLVDLVR